MALNPETVKNILLEELRSKGYAPNPADVSTAVRKIVDAAAAAEAAGDDEEAPKKAKSGK